MSDQAAEVFGNKQAVGVQGEEIVVLLPKTRMSKTEALVHASYLVFLATAKEGDERTVGKDWKTKDWDTFDKVFDATITAPDFPETLSEAKAPEELPSPIPPVDQHPVPHQPIEPGKGKK